MEPGPVHCREGGKRDSSPCACPTVHGACTASMHSVTRPLTRTSLMNSKPLGSTFDSSCSVDHSISMPSPFQGYACAASEEEIKAFMSYKKASICPDDWFEVQNLRYVKNCHSLPMRRCLSPTPPNPTEVGTHRIQYWRSLGGRTHQPEAGTKWSDAKVER